MRPLLQHALRSIFANAATTSSQPFAVSPAIANLLRPTSNRPSICIQCRFRYSVAIQRRRRAQPSLQHLSSLDRQFHQTPNEERRPLDEREPSAERRRLAEAERSSASDTETSAKQKLLTDKIARVPAEDLPSHREAQRWDFSKRLTELMDELLPKLAVVTQKVNTYTGTDYSGIEALRREIQEQEKLVKARRAAIEEAKLALDAAHSQQASSQKEVVALLERKHSWSATDLERYMALIRSEHVNDQAVREAKEAVTAAENALEEARSQLEKRERAQYHEEQIWSDTIRRNSTWVTFGLMGFNIFILLASLVLIEPWRRRRMVREIKAALEAQKSTGAPTATSVSQLALPISLIEAEIDKVVEATAPEELLESTTRPAEDVDKVEPSISLTPSEGRVQAAIEETTEVEELVSNSVSEPSVPAPTPLIPEGSVSGEAAGVVEQPTVSPPPVHWQQRVAAACQDLISERTISIRKIDFTAAMLESAALGALISATVIALLRPR